MEKRLKFQDGIAARFYSGRGDPGQEVEDEWKKLSGNPLWHMTAGDWDECHESVSQIFTGGDDSDVEDGERVDRYFEIGKDDVMFADSRRKRKMARGEATLDIDSVLALFTDLSMVNTKIVLSILANPNKNLRQSVHISHKGIPLHWIPHSHLGRFGDDIQFDLFIFLPALYNKDRKRRKNNLFNHVTEELRVEFMDKCLLPAIRDVVTPNEGQSWDFSYVLSQVKSNANCLKPNCGMDLGSQDLGMLRAKAPRCQGPRAKLPRVWASYSLISLVFKG